MRIRKTGNILKVGLGAVVAGAIVLPGMALAAPEGKMEKSNASLASGTPVNFDLENSRLKWTGKKVTGSHWGELKLRHAAGLVTDDNGVNGVFEVDMRSLNVKDIKDPKDNAKLANHLKSDDFFSVSEHPVVAFTIKDSTPIEEAKPGEPNMLIKGDLTITGITQPVEFPALVTIEDGKAEAKATVALDRTKWNVRYGSGKFFENLGDRLIYDEFTVELDLVGELAQG